tara:strand:+ start:62 stop:499 length:438 start_codon:yes stop_codon:yes gene_type:complete
MNPKQEFHFHKNIAEKTIEKANKIANSFHQKTSEEAKEMNVLKLICNYEIAEKFNLCQCPPENKTKELEQEIEQELEQENTNHDLEKRNILLENENKLLRNQQLKYRNTIMFHKEQYNTLQSEINKLIDENVSLTDSIKKLKQFQ